MSRPDAQRPPRNWVAVACAAHARRGRDEMQPGFMQVCHGKPGPLRRLHAGDRVVYYAPTLTMDKREPCQRFVTLGTVLPGAPYAYDMGGGFVPHRRDVAYIPANETPIRPLLDTLHFTQGRTHWGQVFRYGLLSIDDHDMAVIAQAMGAAPLMFGPYA